MKHIIMLTRPGKLPHNILCVKNYKNYKGVTTAGSLRVVRCKYGIIWESTGNIRYKFPRISRSTPLNLRHDIANCLQFPKEKQKNCQLTYFVGRESSNQNIFTAFNSSVMVFSTDLYHRCTLC